MATQTLTTADAILKDLYVGPIVEQLNMKTYLLDQIERDSDHIDHTGRRAIIPVHTGRNRGRGSRGDGGTLPAAGYQTWADAIVNIKYHYSGIELTDGSIEASTSNEGAFVNILSAETKGVANDMRKDINRQVFGSGDGLLGAVAATVSTTTTMTLDSVQYVAVGDAVDVLRRTDGDPGLTNSTNNPVTTRTGGSTKSIVLTSAVGGAITTAYGVYLNGSYGKEMDGLRNIVSTTRTLHSINSATAGNQYWDGQVRNVGTSAGNEQVAGETVFEQLADDVGLTGQGEVTVFLTSRGVRRRLADTYQTQKRFNDAQAVRVHGGYSAIMVNEIPVVADDDCPRTFAFGIDKSALRWFQQAGPGWMEKGGGGIFHLKDGATAGTKVATWQAFFRWYSALGCVAPNRLGKLQFATDDDPA